MARNPYQMDPYLQQGFSNLTKALIGDAETDYQVARTGYQTAQTNRLNTLLPFEQQSLEAQIAQRNAAANASNSQAGLYTSQTRGQDLENQQITTLNEALSVLAASPEVQAQLSASTGFDFSKSENQAALGSALFNAMFSGKGNVEQRTNAFTNMANQANTNQAFNQIMDPNATPDQLRQAYIAGGNSPGQFFDSGVAQSREENTLAANLDKNAKNLEGVQYTADRKLEGDKYKANQVLEGTRVTAAATERYQNFKSNLQFGEGGQGDRNKSQDIAQAQWEVNNKPLEFVVTPGQQIVLSPEAGERIGLEPQPDGLYVLDGGPAPGAVRVSVGTSDVYLTEEDAVALGIPKNENGQYMIEGRPTPTNKTGDDATTYAVPPSVANSLKKQLNSTVDALGYSDYDVPAALLRKFTATASKDYGANRDATQAENMIVELLGNPVLIDPPGLRNKFRTPQSFIDEIEELLITKGLPEKAKEAALAYGYDETQADAVIAYIRSIQKPTTE